MVTTEYTINEASGLIKEGKIDFVQLGHPFVYNPVRLVAYNLGAEDTTLTCATPGPDHSNREWLAICC